MNNNKKATFYVILLAIVTLGGFAFLSPSASALQGGGQIQVPTTNSDFFMFGSQPNTDPVAFNPILSAYPLQNGVSGGGNCIACHGNYDDTVAPFDTWVVSMMGQSARDPVWRAAVAIAAQDVNDSNQFCFRCHAPSAWLQGRKNGPIAIFTAVDMEGINCNFCHRLVNPTTGPLSAVGYPNSTAGPLPDPAVVNPLAAVGVLPPQNLGNATYVVDPIGGVRRGPFDDIPMVPIGPNNSGAMVGPFHQTEIIYSPYHKDGALCGTCHDVSNPVYSAQPDGHLVLNTMNRSHPTMDRNDMFGEQRTFSEWLNSTFATTGVYFPDRRFGGNHATGVMKSCQDCHMPAQEGPGCNRYAEGPASNQFPPGQGRIRPNVPQHSWAGSNTWVLRAIVTQLDSGFYPGVNAVGLGMTPARVDESISRNFQMLRDASDMELTQSGSELRVKITNQTGHKLPTGYPEGRRAWINVKFYGANDVLIAERGHYDMTTATLTDGDTKVYETEQVIGAETAAATGLPAGTHFHLSLASETALDNRIPPRGFTNAAFAAVGAAPVAYTYADGQYWDFTNYAIPSTAVKAAVSFYYQTSSKEYMEFLRDTTTSVNAQNAYNLWVLHGKSAPALMDSAEIVLAASDHFSNPADLNGDGVVSGIDLATLLSNWGGSGAGDINGDGIISGPDLAAILSSWGQ